MIFSASQAKHSAAQIELNPLNGTAQDKDFTRVLEQSKYIYVASGKKMTSNLGKYLR